jgi:hypothetical protein
MELEDGLAALDIRLCALVNVSRFWCNTVSPDEFVGLLG